MIPKPVRRLVWERAGDCCEKCGKGLTRESDHSLHHRKPRGHGDNTVSNLLLLCGTGTTECHGYVTEEPKDALLNGWSVLSTENPQTYPFRHWSGRDLFLLPDGNYGEEVWAA